MFRRWIGGHNNFRALCVNHALNLAREICPWTNTRTANIFDIFRGKLFAVQQDPFRMVFEATNVPILFGIVALLQWARLDSVEKQLKIICNYPNSSKYKCNFARNQNANFLLSTDFGTLCRCTDRGLYVAWTEADGMRNSVGHQHTPTNENDYFRIKSETTSNWMACSVYVLKSWQHLQFCMHSMLP